jgi:tRNA (uracil-5-)-methyltransferase TRM9
MNAQTVAELNAINRMFYHRQAEAFSSTRRSPWKGWERLLESMTHRFPHDEVISVLDVGCGNGRFARYLSEQYLQSFSYVGVDVSSRALDHARRSMPDTVSAEWIQHDIVADPPKTSLPPEARRPFSLVAVFGLLHHVPGSHLRRSLVAECARVLTSQGILALSVWQFGRFDRFKRKIVPWAELEAKTGIKVDRSQLEPGDHILTWGADPPAYRYCHFLDAGETHELVNSLPLQCIDSYDADGETGDLNRYYLLGSGVKS